MNSILEKGETLHKEKYDFKVLEESSQNEHTHGTLSAHKAPSYAATPSSEPLSDREAPAFDRMREEPQHGKA